MDMFKSGLSLFGWSEKKVTLGVESGTDITRILQREVSKEKSNIIIPEGDFYISETIKLSSKTVVAGSGDRKTKIILSDTTNDNMFTNSDLSKGNHDIHIENLWLEGNSLNQFRPETEKRLSFCNLFYFKKSSNIKLIDIKATNCKQTAMHFNTCSDVTIDGLSAIGMGWSGISTSGTDNIRASNAYIYDSGKDVMHSGVHYDGGIGSYFKGTVEKCTGNGIMLDSKYATFNKSVIESKCIDCKRGVSLSGDHNNLLSNVLVNNSDIKNCEVGIMVSNSSDVFLSNNEISGSSEYGVLLQGKNGGCNTVVSDVNFSGNKIDIAEIHSSKNNYFIQNIHEKNSKNKFNQIKKETKVIKEVKTKEKAKVVDSYTGNCSVCGEVSSFVYEGGSVRESYRCESCNASLRHRGQAKAIVDIFGREGTVSIKELALLDSFRDLVIYEPGIIGPLRKYFNRLPNYTKSYYWDDIALGESKDGVPNQNLECLTYEDNSVDLLITADIFEHIRKPWIAFEEIYRVLKPGGKHIFTVPIQYPLPKETIYRVDTSTNEDKHILPEHYHIAGDGGRSLVYTDFGGDLLTKLGLMGLHTDYMFIDTSNQLRKKNITLVSTKL